RLRVGEIVLLFVCGLRLLHIRAWLPGLLRRLPRALLQRPLRRANLLQPALAPLQLCGQLVAAPIDPVVRVSTHPSPGGPFRAVCRRMPQRRDWVAESSKFEPAVPTD